MAARRPRFPRPKIDVDRVVQGNKHGKRGKPLGVVIHSTESHDRPGTKDVEGVLRFLEGTEDRLGIHYVIDRHGNVGRGALDDDLVYHCRGANDAYIGIELIGFARFSLRTWRLRRRQVYVLARLLAHLSDRHDIPLKRSTRKGVALHRDFPQGGHWDPGYGFPTSSVLKKARRELSAHRKRTAKNRGV